MSDRQKAVIRIPHKESFKFVPRIQHQKMRQRTPTGVATIPGGLPLIDRRDPPEDPPSNFEKRGPPRRRRRKTKSSSSSSYAPLLLCFGFLLVSVGCILWMTSDVSPFPTISWFSSTTIIDNDGPPADLVVHGSREYYTPVPPRYRKKAWIHGASESHIQRAYRHEGYFISTEPDDFGSGHYHILYSNKLKQESKRHTFSVGRPWQRYSRLPGGTSFAAKDNFFEGFRNLQRQYDNANGGNGLDNNNHNKKKDLMYFIPESYKLDEVNDQKAFQKVIDNDKKNDRNRPWVLKKVKLNNGRGIEMIPPDSPALYSAIQRSQENEENEYIVQSYICNELTWFGGKKFDLRFYWLVASVDPLIVLYHDGYARVAAAVYNESDWKSTGQHLTNHEFRVDLEDRPVDEDVLAPAVWRRIREHYESDKARLSKILPPGQHDPVAHVRNQMKEAISTTVEAFKADLGLKGSQNRTETTTENLFAFYGADFVIDQDLDIYYLEGELVSR